MSEAQPPRRPAYARESVVLRLPGTVTLDDLSPEWAWGGATGKGVRVAVVDSGVEADHPALEGCVDADAGLAISVGPDDELIEAPGPHDDAFGHGTACAGVIHSFAPEARITSVKVLGAGLVGKAAAFLRGLGWAVEHGFDVINLSLGTNRREWALPFYEVCDKAYFAGSVVVTAANNMPRPSFPSLYGTVISVACNLARDLMGKVSFSELAFLLVVRRLPTAGELGLLDAVLVSLTDHGLTPTVLAARLTHTGAPESLQGAIDAIR